MVGPVDGTRTRRELVVAALLAATSGCQTLGRDSSSTGTESPADNASTDGSPSAVGKSTPGATPETQDYQTRGINFDRAVDVTAAGADPSGKTDSSPAITAAANEGTLLVFPAGTYRIDSAIEVGADRVGLIADGDVTIRPSSSVSGRYLVAENVDSFLFRGIDVDIRSQRRAGMKVHARTEFHIDRVRYRGRGGLTGQAFNLAVKQDQGAGYLRRVRVPEGGIPDRYDNKQGVAGNGRIGVWAGLAHHGTLRVVESEFSEFGNNGMYTSRTPGDIQVEDSYFENNNVCGVRISGAGSWVRNSEVLVDFSRYDGPELTDTGTGFNPRGIMIDGGKRSTGMPNQQPGAEIRDSTVTIRQVPRGTTVQSAIEQNPVARTLRVVNTDIRVDVTKTPAVRRPPPGSGNWVWRPGEKRPPAPHWTRLENVTVTGTSTKGSVIHLSEAHGSQIRNCDIRQAGSSRDGVHLQNTFGTVVDDGSIRVGSFPIVLEQTEEMDDGGCWLRFGDVPELTSTSGLTGETQYAELQPGYAGSCALSDLGKQLPNDSWVAQLTATDDGTLVGPPPN